MRAAVVERTGPPEVLRVADVAAREPGPREIRIAVAACGVCFHDVVVRNGTFRRGVGLPVILGHEVAGDDREAGRGRARAFPRRSRRHHDLQPCLRPLPPMPRRPRDVLSRAGFSRRCRAQRRLCRTRLRRCRRRAEGAGRRRAGGSLHRRLHGRHRAQRGARRRPRAARRARAGNGRGRRARPARRAACASRRRLHDRGDDDAGQGGAHSRGGRGRGHRRREGRGFFRRGAPLDRWSGASMPSSTMSALRCSRRCAAAWPMAGASCWSGSSPANSCRSIPAQLFLRNVSILSAKGVSRAQLADALDLVARGRVKPVIEGVYRAGGRRRSAQAGGSRPFDGAAGAQAGR